MISTRVLRRRIRSIQNTAKITKAMELVATAKMKRAQDQATAGRPYADKISQVIADLTAQHDVNSQMHPLLEKRPVKKIAIIHITTDRGLCGGLNANANRLVGNFVLEQKTPVTLVTVGRKGRDFMRRYGREIEAEFTGMSDRPGILDILPIARIIIEDYTKGKCDLVYLAYSKFVSTIVQKPVLEPLLPITPAEVPKGQSADYIYEPSSSYVLNALLPRFVETEIYHAVLENIASEQSARMVAMRNATDNAREIIDDLTLQMNKARQEQITKELLDITGGAAALESK
ncbi:MAG: ATP synthase F1 subunit gamma [Chloroflexota bacterium]